MFDEKKFLQTNGEDVMELKECQKRDREEGNISPEEFEAMQVNKVDDYVVYVRFSETDYTATDALKDYIRKIADLKY